jgi:hypothetical protein
MTVWFPSEIIRYRGLVGFTVPTVSLSRTTDRFAGYEIPLMDTLSDPFNSEVLLAVAFIVLFKPGSDVLENGVKPGSVDVFTVFLFVMATQPATSINPSVVKRTNVTNSFIGSSVTRIMTLFNNSMLQGTLALQFGFRTAGRNPEVLEQQLRDTKYTPP